MFSLLLVFLFFNSRISVAIDSSEVVAVIGAVTSTDEDSGGANNHLYARLFDCSNKQVLIDGGPKIPIWDTFYDLTASTDWHMLGLNLEAGLGTTSTTEVTIQPLPNNPLLCEIQVYGD
jgi:hypothetical protein